MKIDQISPKGSGQIVDNFSTFCEGDTEPTLNKKIHTLIQGADNYIVYLDEDLMAEWSWNYAYGDDPPGFADTASKIAHLETLSLTQLRANQKDIKEVFERLLAEGMARIIGEKDEKRANEILNEAEKFLQARGTENARIWYLSGASAFSIPMLLTAFILWLLKNDIVPYIGINLLEVIIGTFIGGFGAFISVLYNNKKIQIDPAAGALIHYIESGARIVIGNAGALIISLAIKANLVLSVIKSIEHSFAAFLVFCLMAGVSERFLPSFIEKIEKSITNGKEK